MDLKRTIISLINGDRKIVQRFAPPPSPAPKVAYQSPAAVLANKPDWVKREISQKELGVLRYWISKTGSAIGGEVGVASGFSSAFLLACLNENTHSPHLFSFDKAIDCYFDATRKTGQVFREIHGTNQGFHLTTGVTSESAQMLPPLDFLFIDGSHATPWPAIDVLSLGRYLKPGGWIALDDIEMPLSKRWHGGGKNGARDLWRAWVGPKVRYEGVAGMAILHNVNPEILVKSCFQSMLLDWDVNPLNDVDRDRLMEVFEFYGPMWSRRLKSLFRRKRRTISAWKPTPLPEAAHLEVFTRAGGE